MCVDVLNFALKCVAMYVYVLIYAHKYVCTGVYVRECTDLCTQVCMCVDVLIFALKCVCVWMYRSVHSNVYVCGCIDLCAQVCMCVDV